MLVDTTEAQKQAALLEKKIALERETQKALDPEVGAAEVRAMQREIHRMRLRYAARNYGAILAQFWCNSAQFSDGLSLTTTGTRSCRSGRS